MDKHDAILTEGPILPEFIAHKIASHYSKKNMGAHFIFLGQVRADIVEGKPVKEVIYTAYEEMVSKEIQSIKDEIFSKYSDLKCIYIYHSTGPVKTGEISLFVFISSGHRSQAFKACEETVELIKHKVPVWKKEIYEDDSYSWKK